MIKAEKRTICESHKCTTCGKKLHEGIAGTLITIFLVWVVVIAIASVGSNAHECFQRTLVAQVGQNSQIFNTVDVPCE